MMTNLPANSSFQHNYSHGWHKNSNEEEFNGFLFLCPPQNQPTWTCEIIECLGQKTRADQEWDNLLHRSSQCPSGCTAEVLECFRKQFFPRKKLIAFIVRDSNGQAIAGLPLLSNNRSKRFPFRTLKSVSNDWFPCCSLLKDNCIADLEIASTILDRLISLRPHAIDLDWAALEMPEIQALALTARLNSHLVLEKKRFEVGISRLPKTWELFEQSQSKNCRKRIRSELKKISQIGLPQLEVIDGSCRQQLSSAMREALQIERQSWKGEHGSAIVCHPKAEQFYLRFAEATGPTGRLRLFFLRLDGQRIAFDLGEICGARYRSLKVSYLSRFADWSPGHVLNQFVFNYFIQHPSVDIIDSVGPLNDANRRWSNDVYRVGRLIINPGAWTNNTPGWILNRSLRLRNSLKNLSFKTLPKNLRKPQSPQRTNNP